MDFDFAAKLLIRPSITSVRRLYCIIHTYTLQVTYIATKGILANFMWDLLLYVLRSKTKYLN